MLLSLVALAGMATFAGGNANEFARSLAEATHQNVVVCQSMMADLPAVTYDPGDLTLMARALRAKTGLAIAPGARLTLSDEMIEPTRLSQLAKVTVFPEWKKLDDGCVKDGKVTLETTGRDRLDPASLESLPFSRPVKVHWFFAKLPVSVWVHEMPEMEFLTYVAKSVGAQMLTTKDGYKLEFDPAEVRRRTIARIEAWPKKWLPERNEYEDIYGNRLEVRFNMLKGALNSASPGDLIDAFKTPESSAKYAVARNSPLVRSFITMITPIMKQDEEPGVTGIRTPMGMIRLPEQLEGERPIDVTLKASFEVAVLCRIGDIGGKPANISFDFSDNEERLRELDGR